MFPSHDRGARKNPDDDPSIYTIPRVTNIAANDGIGSLWDYLGLPTEVPIAGDQISALPFRAYNLIWNEWYRDQNLQDRVTETVGNGLDSMANYALLKRGKRHDYFTSCLPWPQKGDPVSVPIGDQAPIEGLATRTAASNSTAYDIDTGASLGAQDAGEVFALSTSGTGVGWTADVYADLTSATSITINELRTAFQIQKLLERDARGGTRYIELILSHFGVQSPDGS